jgi:MFS family permease
MRVHWRSWMAPFFTIWVGQAFSIIGSSLVQFALVWWLTASTGSATVLAAATLAGMLLTGVMNPLANGPLNALLQRTVEPEMQGRVFTVLSSGCAAISPLGLALAGPVTDAVGLRPWYVAAGVVTIGLGLAGLRFRPFMRTEEDAPSTPVSPPEAKVQVVPAPENP